MKKVSMLLVAVVMFLEMTAIAHASLILRGMDTLGNQLIYDTDLDITWYDYSNAPDMWENQMAWADALTVTFGGTIYSDWRLPTAFNQDGTGPCVYYYCTGSEMGDLYYMELGNAPLGLSTSFTDALTGVPEYFLKLLPLPYWSGTEFAPDQADEWIFHFDVLGPAYAWVFHFDDGYQDPSHLKDQLGYALAARPGDVSAVPEPDTMLLLGTGLVGLVAFKMGLVGVGILRRKLNISVLLIF